MRNKKITVEESPLVSPDTVVVKKRHKDLGIDYKTIKLFRDIAKVVAPPPHIGHNLFDVFRLVKFPPHGLKFQF